MAHVRVHIFEDETSEEVYNLTQTNEDFRDGDVLILEKEKIAGILSAAWPVAITENHGEFHSPADPNSEWPRSDYPAAVQKAEWIAFNHGWKVIIAPPF